MPVGADDLNEYGAVGGRFFNLRKELKPGEKIKVKLVDISKNTRTKYPLKGKDGKPKDYCYRLQFVTCDGNEARIMDINSIDLVKQAFRSLYPSGIEGGLKPCIATIGHRADRQLKQSYGEIVKEGDVTGTDGPDTF